MYDEIMRKNSAATYATAKKEATVDEIIKSAELVDRRYGRFLVIEDKYLPHDCYGIFIVRPEDAVDFRKITQ
jgi:hypothetical protein